MSIDINKIIQESVQNTLNEQENNDEVTSITESTEEDVKSQGKTKETNEEVYENDFDPTVASSISAGLGALTFRNHYRALKEQAQSSKWKKAGKIGAGLGAAGLAGAAGLTALGHGDATEGFDKVKGAAGKVVKKVRDKFSDGPGDKTIMNSENARRTTLKAAQGSKYLDTDTGGNEATKLAPKSYGDQIKKLNSLNGLNRLNP